MPSPPPHTHTHTHVQVELGVEIDVAEAVAARRVEVDDSGGDERIRILSSREILVALEDAAERVRARITARDGVAKKNGATTSTSMSTSTSTSTTSGGRGRDVSSSEAPPSSTGRPTVGMVGFPNVGKSSTINALVGSKKVAVASTPGKTKHFQTLLLGDLTLCDCPGLVFPTFASSKPDMVAAGVLPIDRLVNVRTCVEVVASRITRRQWYAVYGAVIPPPASHEDPKRRPTASEAMAAVCIARGWVNGSGGPDETRSGRAILKDFVDGRLLYVAWPPGTPRPTYADTLLHPAVAASLRGGMGNGNGNGNIGNGNIGNGEPGVDPGPKGRVALGAAGVPPATAGGVDLRLDVGSTGLGSSGGVGFVTKGGAARGQRPLVSQRSAAAAAARQELSDMGMGMGMSMGAKGAGKSGKGDKMHKKAPRSKGSRGKGAYGLVTDGFGGGMGVAYGKRGGLVRAPVGVMGTGEQDS